MSEIIKNRNNYVGYEYKEVLAEPSKASLYRDGYESFGWQSEEVPAPVPSRPSARNTVAIRLRRDRKIADKMELTRLQRHFEACLVEIQTLERSKLHKATILALAAGILGTVFMAGSTFAVTADPPIIWLCILLAIPGLTGWILPYFLFKKELNRQREKLAPLLEAKYEELYTVCEKGSRLL